MTLFVECYADEALVCGLGIAKRDIRHAFGRGEVCNLLKKTPQARGLIDEDPLSAPAHYLDGLRVVREIAGFRVLQDAAGEHTVVVLTPRLEEWILAAARLDKITLVEYGLPDDAHRFREEVNLFDYGDEWLFVVELAGYGAKEPKVEYPRVIASKGKAPKQYPEEE